MQIAQNAVVSIHYTLRNNDGHVLDSSEGREPLSYIHGIGHLIPGMEEGLEGKLKGDKLEFSIAPEKGYGTHDTNLIQKVPRSAFGAQDVRRGMQFQAGDDHGRQVVTIVAVEDDVVTVDGNHPLAGVDLHFNVEVIDVRQATTSELDHGHVHGPGGHEH